MPGIFAKLGQFVVQGTKNVAAGRAQASLGLQSPHLAGAFVRVGRFAYGSLAAWITFSWYTGYVNQRVPITESWATKWIVPGGGKAVISPPDRPNKKVPGLLSPGGGGVGVLGPLGEPLEELIESGAKQLGVANVGKVPSRGRTLVALSPAQLGVPGTAEAGYLFSAPDGQKQKPPYNAARYQQLITVATSVAHQFGLKITSGYRPQSSGSMHGVGLAFDMVGRMSDMKRAATWASQNPGLFQEIFVHNEGSGMHLHIAFYPNAAEIFNSKSAMYSRASNRAAPAPAASRVNPIRS